jgi:hypothetical protein
MLLLPAQRFKKDSVKQRTGSISITPLADISSGKTQDPYLSFRSCFGWDSFLIRGNHFHFEGIDY